MKYHRSALRIIIHVVKTKSVENKKKKEKKTTKDILLL